MNQYNSQLDAAFKEADADQDGLLNKEEFKVLLQKDYEIKLKVNGGAVNLASMADHWFMACNTLDVSYSGISRSDISRA